VQSDDEDDDEAGQMPTPNPRDESAERRFNWTENLKQSFREELEKLVILDYIMRNTDRGLDNWMIKIDWGTEQVSIVADPPKSTEPQPKHDEDDLMPPPRPVSVNSNGSNPYRRRETMMAVSRTGTPLASSEQQASVQVGAIDNSLSWPWKHPDAVCPLYSTYHLANTNMQISGGVSPSDGFSYPFL
jgi:hypothetical protein